MSKLTELLTKKIGDESANEILEKGIKLAVFIESMDLNDKEKERLYQKIDEMDYEDLLSLIDKFEKIYLEQRTADIDKQVILGLLNLENDYIKGVDSVYKDALADLDDFEKELEDNNKI